MQLTLAGDVKSLFNSPGLLQVTSPFDLQSDTPMTAKDKIEEALSPFIDFVQTQQQDNETRDGDDCEPSPTNPPVVVVNSHLKPKVVHGSYFLIDIFEENDDLYRIKKGTYDPSENMDGKVLSCTTGMSNITSQVDKAKEIFHRMFPDEEFLPKAPDMAEEIEENGFLVEEDPTDPPLEREPAVQPLQDQEQNNVPDPIQHGNIDENAA